MKLLCVVALATLAMCRPPQSQSSATSVEASLDADRTPPGDASPESGAAEDAGLPAPAIGPDEAQEVLFPAGAGRAEAPACARGDTDANRIRCAIARRYPADAEARAVALDLYRDTGDVAGVEREQSFDGGYRGTIHLVPEPPVGSIASSSSGSRPDCATSTSCSRGPARRHHRRRSRTAGVRSPCASSGPSGA